MAGQLVANLVRFARLLRSLGIGVQPASEIELVRALDLVDLSSRLDVYYAARSLLVTRHDQLATFDRAFELFWQVSAVKAQVLMAGTRPPSARRRLLPSEGTQTSDSITLPHGKWQEPTRPESEPDPVHAAETYSPAEILRKKDFALLTEQELEEVKQLMADLVLDIGARRSRRWLPVGSGPIDIPASIRGSLRADTELLQLVGREPKWKPRALVLIADISGSMERYSGMLLRFICGVARSQARPVEAFVFGTQLTHITRQLYSRDVERAVSEITRRVPDWSGGTRIGQSLRSFNLNWARRVLGRGAVVLLISDGWDRGDVAMLGREMARLQRSCHRLMWLNPLLGSPRYEPLTLGLQAALPYVDDFLPIHNLESVEQLITALSRLSPQRPARRQQSRMPVSHPTAPKVLVGSTPPAG